MNPNTFDVGAVGTVETRLAEAHGVIRCAESRLGTDPEGRLLLQRAQAWCILIGFYLATLDEAWGAAVPQAELVRIGSHAAERYLSAVGGALCGVLRAPGAQDDEDRASAVHDVREAVMRILDALLHPEAGPLTVRVRDGAAMPELALG